VQTANILAAAMFITLPCKWYPPSINPICISVSSIIVYEADVSSATGNESSLISSNVMGAIPPATNATAQLLTPIA
jgi:hypothetical protein